MVAPEGSAVDCRSAAACHCAASLTTLSRALDRADESGCGFAAGATSTTLLGSEQTCE